VTWTTRPVKRCPNCNRIGRGYRDQPDGYLDAAAWAEWMLAHGYAQKACFQCGLFTIWTKP
jgi:hypothetical protein